MSQRQKHDEGCPEYNSLSRRHFIQWSGAAAFFASTAVSWVPQVAWADSDSQRDIIVHLYLRGGCDGLTMCVPFGDPGYYSLRTATVAVPPPDVTSPNRAIDLNGYFGLPPAMQPLKAVYDAGDLAVVHATGLTDPTKSHFDAQRFMEVGLAGIGGPSTGWLGRHLIGTAPSRADAPLRALAFNSGLPVTLAGGPQAMPVPDPANFGLTGQTTTRTARRNALDTAYARDLALRTVASNTMRTIDLLASIPFTNYVPAGGANYGTSTLGNQLRAAACLIRADTGVEAVSVDFGGWDTHSNQGVFTGTMSTNMSRLATVLLAFYTDLHAAGLNNRVTTVILSEFGRTARDNGSGGTDHGRGNVMFAMGGNIRGGQVLTQWPGLGPGQLSNNSDLQITIDHRDILAEIVQKRLLNPNLAGVFPNYTPTMRGIAD